MRLTISLCTMFITDLPYEDGVIHVTHKYLDEQPIELIKDITAILDNYFSACTNNSFTGTFDTPEMFGPTKETRVLVPSQPVLISKGLLDLKDTLEMFRKDDFPVWKPHVTTDLDVVSGPWTRFVLVSGSTIFREYRLLDTTNT